MSLDLPHRLQSTYHETFREGPGGWIGWRGQTDGAYRLETDGKALVSRSPWWVDYNHAPPGGGYLHLLYVLHTFHGEGFPEKVKQLGGVNRFVLDGHPRDFTHARVSLRWKGEIDLKGARCSLLVQSKVRGTYINLVFRRQCFDLTPDWSWQTLTLDPDPQSWTPLGSRFDRLERYGDAPVSEVLKDVNGDIIIVLFPLTVQPAGNIDGDPHRLRAGEDYPVRTDLLPSGHVVLDEVRIEFRR
ncbi:MAG: hypothetical protein JNG83_12835 [Opitutaceae bacterium]|nr:hypothetical protein [Opitutaceae bacterium]